MAESKSQQLTCPICLEVLQSPKILPCLHSFCQQCIHEIILSTVQNKESKPKQFGCPICHTVVKPKDPTTNIEKWASLLQDNTAVSTAERQECHTCKHHNETSVAKFWCKNCIEAFCEKCKTMHGWIKLTSSHNVIPIDDANYNDSGIDLEVISEKCSHHPVNIIEAFCSDHEELCCVLCVTSSHRKCENVKAISKITETKHGNETLEKVLQKIRLETQKLLEDKEKMSERLNESAKTVEDNALKFVHQIKCRLDDMFGNFIKQLRIIQDEQNANPQTDIKLLRDFLSTLGHWIEVTEVVRKFGTKTQFFIHSKTMIGQIKENISQLMIKCNSDFDISLSFDKTDALIHVANELQIIGTTTVKTVPLKVRTKELYELCHEIRIRPLVYFNDMCVKNVRNIFIQDVDIACGVFIDNTHIIVGAKIHFENRLYLINVKTGGFVNINVTVEYPGEYKSICFDKYLNRLFVSSQNGELRMVKVHEYNLEEPQKIHISEEPRQVDEFFSNKPRKLPLNSPVGAMSVYENFVYVVMNDKIQKFKSSIQPTSEDKFTLCFETNTRYSRVNGLAVQDGKVFYTSTNKEIKCSTLQGKELFCYKSASLSTPECLTVTPTGVVVVVDRKGNGSLHAVSSDGKESKSLLRKFNKIEKPPMDLWTDDRGETICVCGGQYIEVYQVDSEK